MHLIQKTAAFLAVLCVRRCDFYNKMVAVDYGKSKNRVLSGCPNAVDTLICILHNSDNVLYFLSPFIWKIEQHDLESKGNEKVSIQNRYAGFWMERLRRYAPLFPKNMPPACFLNGNSALPQGYALAIARALRSSHVRSASRIFTRRACLRYGNTPRARWNAVLPPGHGAAINNQILFALRRRSLVL